MSRVLVYLSYLITLFPLIEKRSKKKKKQSCTGLEDTFRDPCLQLCLFPLSAMVHQINMVLCSQAVVDIFGNTDNVIYVQEEVDASFLGGKGFLKVIVSFSRKFSQVIAPKVLTESLSIFCHLYFFLLLLLKFQINLQAYFQRQWVLTERKGKSGCF